MAHTIKNPKFLVENFKFEFSDLSPFFLYWICEMACANYSGKGSSNFIC